MSESPLHEAPAVAANAAGGAGVTNAANAAIFDLDGTLFDTFDEHHDSWRLACAEHGVPLTPEQFRWSFGRRNEEIIPVLWRAAGKDPPAAHAFERVAERKEELFRQRFLAAPRLMPGAETLLRALRERAWRLAAGSSAPPANVRAFVANLPEGVRFDAVVSGADVTRGKPHPDVFLRAAELIGARAERTIVFEDAPPGIEAAHRAGMRCVAIASRGRTRLELADADLVIDDFGSITVECLASLDRLGPCEARRP